MTVIVDYYSVFNYLKIFYCLDLSIPFVLRTMLRLIWDICSDPN